MIFSKASFKSRIGILHYIWLSGQVRPELVFLSSSSISFKDYLEKLQKKFPYCFFKDEKSGEIEDAVTGYLSGELKSLDLKTRFFTGNAFERKVWKATGKIPYGEVLSYREIAEKAGYPGAWRAAGTALGHNPVMLVIPCHRVIRSSGEIGCFGGGEDIKEWLLNLEQPGPVT